MEKFVWKKNHWTFFRCADKEEVYGPEIIKSPTEVIAKEHDRAQFLVKVIGMPTPTGNHSHWRFTVAISYWVLYTKETSTCI